MVTFGTLQQQAYVWLPGADAAAQQSSGEQLYFLPGCDAPMHHPRKVPQPTSPAATGAVTWGRAARNKVSWCFWG